MKELKNNENKNNLLQKVGKFLKEHPVQIAGVLFVALVVSGTVQAAPDADNLWVTVSNLLKTWVTRLGGVVMFVGAVMFGLGYKTDDPNQKTNVISTMVAGGIVIAAAQIISQFFA